MGIFSNLRKQADDNVGIPDVDAWLNEDGDVALDEALPDLPPPPQAPEMEDRRAPAPDAIVPSDSSPPEPAPVDDSSESDAGGLWNLPDFDEDNGDGSGAISDLAPPSPSLPSIAEIAQGIPPAGSGFPTPDSHQDFGSPNAGSPFDSPPRDQGPSTGFEGLSQAVGANSPTEPAAEMELAPAIDSNDVRWDQDVVKYEPEVPAALQAIEPGNIPMPIIPPPDMEIDSGPELTADPGFSSDLEFDTEFPASPTNELHAPMPMPVIPPADLDAPDASHETVDAAWAVSPETEFNETEFNETGFGDADVGGGASFFDVPDVPSMPSSEAVEATSAMGAEVSEPATTDENDAGFSLSNFFGRKKPKDTEADGFADLYEPVADDPFGNNVGLGNADVAVGVEAINAPVLNDMPAPVELDETFAIDPSTHEASQPIGALAEDAQSLRAPNLETSFDTESFDAENFDAESFDTDTFAGEAFEPNTFDGDALAGQPLSAESLTDDGFGETSPSDFEIDASAAPAWDAAGPDEIVPDLAVAPTESFPSGVDAASEGPTEGSEDLDLTQLPSDAVEPQVSAVAMPSLNEMSLANLEMPAGPQAGMLLEILGLSEGATWEQARDARRVLIAEHNPNAASDDERATLAKAICREMNTAYAALRLLQVP